MKLMPYRYSGFGYTKQTYADFVTSLNSTGCAVTAVGADSAGNTVYAISVGQLTSKPVVMIIGGIHGDHEWRSPHWVAEFMKIIATGPPPFTAWASRMRTTFDLYAIPLVMPYGYINQSYVNANGVNVNRNFDYHWSEFDDSYPNQEKGTAPFSEPESRIVRDAVLAHKPILFVDCHTWGYTEPGAVLGVGSSLALPQSALVQAFNRLVSRSDIRLEDEAVPRPTSTNWVKTQISRNGIYPWSFYIEPWYQETEQEQARLGINMLLQLTDWCATWYRKRVLR